MLLLVAINYIDRASLSVAMPLIAPEFNLSPALEGLMLSAFFWSYALMQIPVGVMLDRYHTRGIIATATLAWGAFVRRQPRADQLRAGREHRRFG
ncbi:MFS transporter, partial [Burkholderia cenocepacia]|nr:MFS transporter [Burkholderia cenocepacia]